MFGETRGMFQRATNSFAIKGLEPIVPSDRGDHARKQLFILRRAIDIIFEIRQHLEMLADLWIVERREENRANDLRTTRP